jgi:hypothetical protein
MTNFHEKADSLAHDIEEAIQRGEEVLSIEFRERKTSGGQAIKEFLPANTHE